MRDKILYILAALTMLMGCSDSVDFNPDEFYPSLAARYLRVSEQEFNFPSAKSDQQSFVVSSIDTPWGFTDVMEWISLSQMSCQQSAEISLSVSENTSGDKERLGIFYVESKAEDWAYNIPLSVYQPAATAYANPELNSITFAGSVSNQTIKVSSNCEWNCRSDADWLLVKKNQDTSSVSINADENLTDVSRSANVYIYKGKECLSVIKVTQRVAEVSVQTDLLWFECTAGAYELRIKAEASWTAKTSQSWIEVSPASGNAGESTLIISAVDNASTSHRNGYVYIIIGDKPVVEIPVRQKGVYIEFSDERIAFPSDEGEKKIMLYSNTSWVISSCPEWVSIVPMSGIGSQELNVMVMDNPNVSSRTSKIVATQPGLKISSELAISQSAKSFQYETSEILCSDKKQVISVNVITTGKWTAKSNDSWISVTPTSMTGNSELILCIEENGEEDKRIGTITLTIGDRSYTVTIIQSGKYITVDYGNTTFGSTGAKLSIEVNTNDSWSAKVENEVSWVSLSKNNGSGNASFVATIADNPSVNSRNAFICITTTNNKSIKIPITQAARYLIVDHQGVNFFASGGTSEDISISTDGQYSLEYSSLWFTIKEKGDGVFNIIATPNATKEEREGVLTIKMTDLIDGSYSIEMPIVQSSYGAVFSVIGYSDDQNWDLESKISATCTGMTDTMFNNIDGNFQPKSLNVIVTGLINN